MAYSYTTFGAVTLPVYNRVADISPAAALPRVIQTLGGAYDLDGSAQAAQVWPHPLTVEAVIWDSTAALLKTAIDALRALVGTRAYLTRQADSDSSTQRALCRLVGVEMQRSHEHKRAIQPVVLNLLQLGPWEAPTATTVTGTGITTATAYTLTNAGNLTCNNAIVTLTVAAGSAITAVAVTGSGISWSLLGAVAAAGYYTIDCGVESVRLGTADAYDRFALAGYVLGSGHFVERWLPLAPGANSITVTPVGGAIDVLFSFRSTWQ